MEEPIVITVTKSAGGQVALTQAQLQRVLENAQMEAAPEETVRLRFPDSSYVTLDRNQLMAAVRELLSLGQAFPWRDLAGEAIQRIGKAIQGRQPLPSIEGGKRGLDYLLEVERYLDWALTLNVSEAERVADLAEAEGCRQTAALLRLLCERAQGRATVPLEDLLEPKESVATAWSQFRTYQAMQRQQRLWKQVLQKLGGMAGKDLRSPEIYCAVLSALREDPSLTPRTFWDKIRPDDTPIFKSNDGKGSRDVLKHESSENEGISYPTLRRYFNRARKAPFPSTES